MPLGGLAGRRALVTGAASGIGQAVLRRLKREGVEAFGCDIRAYEGLLLADLTDADHVEALAGRRRRGGIPHQRRRRPGRADA